MIRLNLLRERRVERPKSLIWQFWLYLAVVLLTAGGAGTIWFFQSRELEQLSMEKSRLDAEIKAYEKYDKILKDLQAKMDDVKKRSEIISSLIVDRDGAVRLLALLAILVPNDSMWFDEIKFSGNSVSVTGLSKSNETIVNFIRNLESSYFVPKESVNLVRSKSEEYAGNVLRRFEMNFQYRNFSQVSSAIEKDQKQEQR
jgi:type IV pilus assembly protein PilN